MNDETITEYENIFALLPNTITTIESIIEHIEITETDKHLGAELFWYYSEETIQAVKDLNLDWNKCHDDFFDTETNEVLTDDDILERYNIKVLHYMSLKHKLLSFLETMIYAIAGKNLSK